ncbi:MAG: hypothetical protein PHP42_09840 [Bacteroidota bacterium]|nr:hypothetical protein [Bacteroidota bacterium]
MRKYLNILSVMMLTVYGALTLVLVPLHRHASEYDGGTHSRNAVLSVSQSNKAERTLKSKECDVCVFSSLKTVAQSAVCCATISHSESFHYSVCSSSHSTDLVSSHPHRGPPNSFV